MSDALKYEDLSDEHKEVLRPAIEEMMHKADISEEEAFSTLQALTQSEYDREVEELTKMTLLHDALSASNGSQNIVPNRRMRREQKRRDRRGK